MSWLKSPGDKVKKGESIVVSAGRPCPPPRAGAAASLLPLPVVAVACAIVIACAAADVVVGC